MHIYIYYPNSVYTEGFLAVCLPTRQALPRVISSRAPSLKCCCLRYLVTSTFTTLQRKCYFFFFILIEKTQ